MIGFQNLQFDQDIFLRTNSLALTPIMICAYLTIYERENIVTFPEQNSPFLLQHIELPPDESIIIPIDRCGDESSSPINTRSKSFHMVYTDRRKMHQPVDRICK